MLCAIAVAMRSVPRWGKGCRLAAPDGHDTDAVATIIGGILGSRLEDAGKARELESHHCARWFSHRAKRRADRFLLATVELSAQRPIFLHLAGVSGLCSLPACHLLWCLMFV